MRDFRDAKVMAQTLRDALTAKSFPITHSESLELVAKMLGFQNWNVVAAKIQSDAPASRAEKGSASQRTRREIEIDISVLDRYVGFYRMADQAVMTISRDGTQLISRLTGQPSVPICCARRTNSFGSTGSSAASTKRRSAYCPKTSETMTRQSSLISSLGSNQPAMNGRLRGVLSDGVAIRFSL